MLTKSMLKQQPPQEVPPLPCLTRAFPSCGHPSLKFLTMNSPRLMEPRRASGHMPSECVDYSSGCKNRPYLCLGSSLRQLLWKGKVSQSHREVLLTEGVQAFLWVHVHLKMHWVLVHFQVVIWFVSKPWLSWKSSTQSQRCLSCWRKWVDNVLGQMSL